MLATRTTPARGSRTTGSEQRVKWHREERGSDDDESRRCALDHAPAYSLTEEDVALRSVCTGLGAHTSRCAATGGNAAVRGVGARLRRTFRVLLHRWLRGWLHRWLSVLLQTLRICRCCHGEQASSARRQY